MARTILDYPPLYPGSSINNVFERNPTTWFRVLALDGTFTLSQNPRPLDGNVGAWLQATSDANGDIPLVIFQWREPRTVRTVRVIWDYQSQEYATSYQIVLFAADNSTLYNYTISNVFVDGFFTFPTAVLVDRIYVRPLKWSKPNARIKVNHMGIMDRYDNNVGWTHSSLNMQGFSEIVGSVKYAEGSFGAVDTSGESSVPGVGIYPTVYWGAEFAGRSDVNNIYTKWAADGRKVYAKVEIAFTDPFSDTSFNIEANTAYGSSTQYLIDGIATVGYKGATMFRNNLSGEYKVFDPPVAKINPPPWWGSVLGNASGEFSPPQVITMTFSSRSINSLRLDGDDLQNDFPVNFTYSLFQGATLVYSITVETNDQVHWFHNIPETILGVDRLQLTVRKVNKPNTPVIISEMFTNIVETYLDGEIGTINLLDEIGYVSSGIPLGNISANEVDISLNNEDRRFDLGNKGSSLYGYVKKNRKVKVFFGIERTDTTVWGPAEVEWFPMGVFWSTTWDIASDSLVARVTARDRLEVLRQSIFYRSAVYQGYTLYDLFRTVLEDAGLFIDVDFLLDPALSGVVIPVAWFSKQSHREALQQLAACDLIQVFCTREGLIRVNLGLDTNTSTPVTTFSDDDMINSARYPLAVTEQINKVSVAYGSYTLGVAGEDLYKHETVITLQPHEVLTTDFVFTSLPIQEVSEVVMEDKFYSIIYSYEVFAWGVRMRIENLNAASAGTIKSITFKGRKWQLGASQSVTMQDDQLILEDGELSTEVSHLFIQSKNMATRLASLILTNYKEARYDVTLEDRGNGALLLTDRLRVDNSQRDAEYMVTKINYSWDGALSATTEGKFLKINE